MREKALVEWNADVPSPALFLQEGLMLDACIYWLRHATRTAIWRYTGKSKARRTGKVTPGLRCHVSTAPVNRSLGEPLGEPISKMRPGGQGNGTQGWHRVGHVDLLQLHERHALLSLHLLALPLLTRQILYLRLREGLDGAQISCRLGLPRRIVRRHLRRAVAALARLEGRADTKCPRASPRPDIGPSSPVPDQRVGPVDAGHRQDRSTARPDRPS